MSIETVLIQCFYYSSCSNIMKVSSLLKSIFCYYHEVILITGTVSIHTNRNTLKCIFPVHKCLHTMRLPLSVLLSEI